MDDKTFSLLLVGAVAFVAGMHLAAKRAAAANTNQGGGAQATSEQQPDESMAWFMNWNRL